MSSIKKYIGCVPNIKGNIEKKRTFNFIHMNKIKHFQQSYYELEKWKKNENDI